MWSEKRELKRLSAYISTYVSPTKLLARLPHASEQRERLLLMALDNPISMEEIKIAINSLPNDRAPRPNGFACRFYKSYWNTIKWDIWTAILISNKGLMKGYGY